MEGNGKRLSVKRDTSVYPLTGRTRDSISRRIKRQRHATSNDRRVEAILLKGIHCISGQPRILPGTANAPNDALYVLCIPTVALAPPPVIS